jgi:hypothetical protein
MKVRFIDQKGNVLVRREDLISAPQAGQHVILADDKDYEVVQVTWDLLKWDDSQLCVELKERL